MDDIEELARTAIDCGFQVHNDIGPGLLEAAYEAFLTAALAERGLRVDAQQAAPVTYCGVTVRDAFRIDLLVERRLIIEIKSVERLAPVHAKQLLTYLRMTDLPLGLLMNFGAERFRDGLQRIINNRSDYVAPKLQSHALKETTATSNPPFGSFGDFGALGEIARPGSRLPSFSHFVAIDWSGAQGERQPGIAVALCDADGGPPRLVKPQRRWSRAEVLDWLIGELPSNSFVGLDLGVSLPFADEGAFFPGWAESPLDAPALWALVDAICAADPHFAAASFVDHPEAARYFRRHGGREGDRFGGGRGRLRVTEHAQRAQGCSPYSNFNLVGAAQVGKSSLTGMRLLHRLRGNIPIWPFDPVPEHGSVLVEIYTSIAALAAGRKASASKLRTVDELNQALCALRCPPVAGSGPIDDHRSDALLTAAWLRANAGRPELWAPEGLRPTLAGTEGWTFGVL